MIYVYAAVAIIIGALGLTSWGLYERSKAAEAHVAVVEQRRDAVAKERDEAHAKIKEVEVQKAELARANEALSTALVERDKRTRALEVAKHRLQEEIDGIKNSLPKEDQACLDRPLPAALAQRLRDPEPSADARH